jgi:glycosyltransferase involved in cell wall biosynthesis
MKIALIGPGIMPIPPNNWGAVESLIWDQYQYLLEKGHNVVIINSPDLKAVANHVNTTEYDFIHLHYDDHASVLTRLINKPFCTTTHYGYIKEHYPSYGHWRPIFDGVLNSPGIIALSPEIKNLFTNSGYNKFIKVLRNGARTKDFLYTVEPSRFGLCLGKVEPRKRQADLANISAGRCTVDFVGPVIDGNFKENETCKYKGIWTKPDLYANLTEYKCLILLSDGEAAPLVVPEALSAGLSLVISETAAANLDTSLPFIHVLPNGCLNETAAETINVAIENNSKYREDIRKYAKDYFDWSVICDEYINIAKEFINEGSISNNSNK